MKKKALRILVAIAVFAFVVAQVAYGIYNYHRFRRSKREIHVVDTTSEDASNSIEEAIEEYQEIVRDINEATEYPVPEASEENVEYEDISESSFEIHFFDVGEGDSTLVECDGDIMLIDGGTPSCSQFLYSYLEQHGISYLDYIVCTHAHEDHVGGLAGALNFAKVGTAYAPITEYDFRSFNSFVKYLSQQEKRITVLEAG